MARVRQIHRRHRSAAFGRRGTPIATPPALPLAEALTLAAEALWKIERGDGERTLAAEILEAHRDGKPLPQGMPLKHAAIHGSYALSAAQEQPSADYDRLQAAKKALFDLTFV